MEKHINVMIKRPGENPEFWSIKNTLEELQRYVDGPIETVTAAKDLVIICNEEGRIRNLPHNCRFLGVDFVGTIIFSGVCGDEFASINAEPEWMRMCFPFLWS